MKHISLVFACFGLSSAALLSAAPDTSKSYPLDTCVVSGEALDSMGNPYIHHYEQDGKAPREVRFCCKGCLKKFNRDPAKYLGKLDAAAAEKDASPAAPAPEAAAHDAHAH